MPVPNIAKLNLKGKRVLIREDFNVPMKNGVITSDLRIRAALPNIQHALKHAKQVLIMSHLGRPQEGISDPNFSLAPVAARLGTLLNMDVPLISNWVEKFPNHFQGPIALLENVRFNPGETENDLDLAKKMSNLADVFIMDAFATSHREEASTCGIATYVKEVGMGLLFESEMEALNKVLEKPARPVVAIIGGSKVSTKLSLLDSLVKKVDYLILGGGIANTFLVAEGYTVGKSLHEPDLIDEAARLMSVAKDKGSLIPLPTDVVVAERFSLDVPASTRLVSQIDDGEKIFDIGPDTIKSFISLIKKAKTILWNGPVGAFEIENFAEGTKSLAKAISETKAYKIAGGGDTLAAIEKWKLESKMDYISTGGGAFLTLLEGKPLPALEALKKRYSKKEEKA